MNEVGAVVRHDEDGYPYLAYIVIEVKEEGEEE